MTQLTKPSEPWAKVERGPLGNLVGWHSLLDHSADVAACFEAVLNAPIPSSRLARLADRESLSSVWVARLCALAALHDFGKANAGFQARWNAGTPAVGHCREALAALCDADVSAALCDVLPINEILGWGAAQDALFCILAHHGRPLVIQENRSALVYWRKVGAYDPVAALKPLGDAVKRWFPEAFADYGEPLPDEPRFWHAALGYLTFADWLGSDVFLFPFANGAQTDRIAWARRRAATALCTIGFNPAAAKAAIGTPAFAGVSPFPPRPTQTVIGELPGRLAILESETGSGKTEGALWRFARLFSQSRVDGLYLALPTRVAASAMFGRVAAAVERLFPDPATRPRVTLAVPGMTGASPQHGGEGLESAAPDATESVVEADLAAHWAAERPKRFLAGTIAVGTIDQALLGAIRVKHAHLRAACLMRSLLVVDEAHASDRYMNSLLEHLLKLHLDAGGHALLLSATLGSSARTRFLGEGSAAPPRFEEAVAAPYPALWSDASRAPVASSGAGREKSIGMTLVAEIDSPDAVARRALEAARAGAKVLVIRNLRRDAIATFEAALAQGGADLLFQCRGLPALHHGRFAREDRLALDQAVEAAFGKSRPDGGLIAIGSQTLEISLDLCSDFLITDLCPADVLLQRLGRLHRHERIRPNGFETPRAIVLSPSDLTPLLAHGAHGMGVFSSGGQMKPLPYPDLLALEATRRLVADHPTWTIPAMNRLLVESATHPQARAALLAELTPAEAWRDAANGADGRVSALLKQAQQARLRYDVHFDDASVVFPTDEHFSSRLGALDLLVAFDPPVTGPFGLPITQVAIPDYWTKGVDAAGDLTPTIVSSGKERIVFSLQGVAFAYDRTGLTRAT